MASGWQDQTALNGKFYSLVQIPEEKYKDQVTAGTAVKFEGFGLEFRFPGGKARDVGVDYHILVMTNTEIAEKVNDKKIYAHVHENQQSLEHDWANIPNAITWVPPNKDSADKSYDEVDFGYALGIVITRQVLRVGALTKDTVFCQVRGVWRFSEEY